MTITPEDVAKLAAAATPGPWLRINALVYALHRAVDWKGEVNRFQAHVSGNGKSGAPDEELEANAAFIAAAHDMADLIAELKAERDALVDALDKLATPQCFGTGTILGQCLSDNPMGREIIARMEYARATLAKIKEKNDE